jgi:putative ABC transport system permease protein
MSTIVRGVRNSFRNTIRTGGVTVILALSVGLALVMLLSLKTVQARIAQVKASVGNTITISPAGARGFEGGGTPLTQANAQTVQAVPHVTAVKATLNDRLTPATDTSLASAIDPGTLGARFRNRGFGGGGDGGPVTARPGSGTGGGTFQIPILVTGATELSDATVGGAASTVKLTSGTAIDSTSTGNVADVGKGLATKNNLAVGSTFAAYNTTFKVVGVYDSGNTFGNAGMIIPLTTEQSLSDQAGQVSQITATVDDISNVPSAVTAIQNKLGSTADVVSQQDQANNAIQPLQNIKTVSLYSLIGALAAGSVIIFLTMLMIVRERRREIGVLKSIGASNAKITGQFVAEALTLTTAGAIVGVVGGMLLSNPILQLLVTSNLQSGGPGGPGGGRGFARVLGFGGRNLQSLHSVVGYDILLYGLAAALIIAVLGSAIPALAIAKVRPAEVMRGE